MAKKIETFSLNEKERMILAIAVHGARKKYPEGSWRYIFEQANKALPLHRRLSANIDHPNKVAWIKPLLRQLEGKPIAPAKSKPLPKDVVIEKPHTTAKPHRVDLNDQEKKFFLKAFLNAKNANPEKGNRFAIIAANELMPAGRKIGAKIDSLKQLPWIIPMLNEADKKPAPNAGKLHLKEEHKKKFAQIVFDLKQNDPKISSIDCIREANKSLPVELQYGKQLHSFGQITWLQPMLEQLGNKPSLPKAGLSDKDKEDFVEIVYKLKKGGASWTRAIREANNFLPENLKIGATICSPVQMPWLQRAYAKLELADTNRLVIDHRGALPKAEEPLQEFGRKKRKQQGASVFLNNEEKQYFADIVYQLRLGNSGWGWHKILTEANREMPAHKQKANMPPSPSQIPWLPKALDEAAKRAKYTPEPVEPPKIETPPAPVAGLDDMMIGMMASMMKQFMPAIMANPEAQKKLQVAMLSSPNNVVAQEAPRPQKKKVVVVGLLPVQTQDTQRDFGRIFDFKFINSNVPSQQIKDSAKHADIAIIMTKFVSHSTQAALQQQPGFTYCNGNSSALKNLLEDKVQRMKAGQ